MNCTDIQPRLSNNALQSSCCHKNEKPSPWLKKIDLICRIAIGVFAAVIAPIPMAISLSIGFTAGILYAATRFLQDKPMFPDGESKPVCAQGYMDFLTGMRFPPIIGTLATATFIAAHMRHDPQFYVPFCGVFIGFWLGRETTTTVLDLTVWVFTPLTPILFSP